MLQSRAQSYNDTVSDGIINKFMEAVLTSSADYKSVFNKLPKKVFYKAINIGKANWDSKMDTTFEEKFRELYRYDSVLSKEDFKFFTPLLVFFLAFCADAAPTTRLCSPLAFFT